MARRIHQGRLCRHRLLQMMMRRRVWAQLRGPKLKPKMRRQSCLQIRPTELLQLCQRGRVWLWSSFWNLLSPTSLMQILKRIWKALGGEVLHGFSLGVYANKRAIYFTQVLTLFKTNQKDKIRYWFLLPHVGAREWRARADALLEGQSQELEGYSPWRGAKHYKGCPVPAVSEVWATIRQNIIKMRGWLWSLLLLHRLFRSPNQAGGGSQSHAGTWKCMEMPSKTYKMRLCFERFYKMIWTDYGRHNSYGKTLQRVSSSSRFWGLSDDQAEHHQDAGMTVKPTAFAQTLPEPKPGGRRFPVSKPTKWGCALKGFTKWYGQIMVDIIHMNTVNKNARMIIYIYMTTFDLKCKRIWRHSWW